MAIRPCLRYRESVYKGERYHTCSDGCHDIFEREPEKYVQAWLPVNQILQGNCGGPRFGKHAARILSLQCRCR